MVRRVIPGVDVRRRIPMRRAKKITAGKSVRQKAPKAYLPKWITAGEIPVLVASVRPSLAGAVRPMRASVTCSRPATGPPRCMTA